MKKALSVALSFACILMACKSANTKNPFASTVMKDTLSLNGTWQLKEMPGTAASFDSLFTRRIPVLIFDLAGQKVSGHTGCNSFSGKLIRNGTSINFTEPMAMTKMFCPGEGENIFLQNLQKVTAFSITNDTTLSLQGGQITLMHLIKK